MELSPSAGHSYDLAVPQQCSLVWWLLCCLQVPACTTTLCTFTANYPQAPKAGTYQATTSVQFQQPAAAQVAVAQVNTAFQVGSVHWHVQHADVTEIKQLIPFVFNYQKQPASGTPPFAEWPALGSDFLKEF